MWSFFYTILQDQMSHDVVGLLCLFDISNFVRSSSCLPVVSDPVAHIIDGKNLYVSLDGFSSSKFLWASLPLLCLSLAWEPCFSQLEKKTTLYLNLYLRGNGEHLHLKVIHGLYIRILCGNNFNFAKHFNMNPNV